MRTNIYIFFLVNIDENQSNIKYKMKTKFPTKQNCTLLIIYLFINNFLANNQHLYNLLVGIRTNTWKLRAIAQFAIAMKRQKSKADETTSPDQE